MVGTIFPDDVEYQSGSPDRLDIRTDSTTRVLAPGIPLSLSIGWRESKGGECAGVPGAITPTVEIWQADAAGQYSGTSPIGGKSGDALRGQATSSRLITFMTVLPGPTKGRAPHINLRIQALNSKGEEVTTTTTLYFDQKFVDHYLQDPAYRLAGNATPNKEDPFFARQSTWMILHPGRALDSDQYNADVMVPIELD
jgi:protocatechuate 3,4-dioxygenase beta subunit